MFVAAFVYVLPEATELIDDHFMHVAWGRQLLYGRRPLTDMEALGLPLQAGLSAVAERIVGYRLFSEGLVFSAAFASAAVMTAVIAQQAARSLWIGVVAALLQVAVFPRTYSYPKLVVYSAAILLLWRYVDAPSKRRAAVIGVATAIAFYLRHDHGIYVGLVGVAMLILCQVPNWRGAVAHLTWFAAACALMLAPHLAYIEGHYGLEKYARSLRSLAVREYQQNRFDSWPRWPLSTLSDFIQWQRTPVRSATIGIRWNEASTDEERRTAAAHYGLYVERDDGPVESGRFLLTDVSTPNVLALLDDPVIEDTANVERATGAVPSQGLWIGPIHLVPGLDTPSGSAAFLFFAFALLLVATAVALTRPPSPGREMLENSKITAVVLIGLATSVGFVREPLAIRVPDAVVAPAVLAAWWAGRAFVRVCAMRSTRHRYAATVAIAAMVLLTCRSVVVIGAVPTRLERLTRVASWSTQLWRTPPADAHTVSRNKSAAVRYIRWCTKPSDPLLVLWFAPDLYYYTDRPFAGRLGFYLEGYWTSQESELINIATIERDRPPIALIESGREVTDLYTYPRLLSYIAETYHALGTLPSGDGRSIRVLARNDRVPSSRDAQLGWPCFA